MIRFVFLLSLLLPISLCAQPASLGTQVADAAMKRWPEGNLNADHSRQTWQYQEGTLLMGITAIWQQTGDPKYLNYLRQAVDSVVDGDGNMAGYKADEYSQDQILMGRQVQLLCKRTAEQRYCKAVEALRNQLRHQPRTASGGYFHKAIYPNQMWLDGLYMSEPFLAEYASTHHDPGTFSDVAHQFLLLEQHVREPRTGLLYHGWDESRKQPWADPVTGVSPSFWARGMGWYAMALVDTLPFFPQDHPDRPRLVAILNRLMQAIVQFQDSRTGVWWEVIDKANGPGNFLESSASAMFVYALDRGTQLGYLAPSYRAAADKAWLGMQKQFVEMVPGGGPRITHIVKGAGLGKGPDNTPYRSGTYDYYVKETVVSDEPKGIGAFLLAASQAERRTHTTAPAGSVRELTASPRSPLPSSAP